MAAGTSPWMVLILAAAGCASAQGEDAGHSWEDRDRLHTTLMPYAWKAAAEGDLVVRGVPASFDEGEETERTFAGRVEVYSERVGFFLDGFYTTVSDRDPTVETDARYGVFDFGTAMRLAGEDPWVAPGDRRPLDFEVDGLALVRTHFLRMEANPAGAFAAATDGAAWADLVLGARGGVTLLGRVTLFGRIDGGGMATNAWRSFTWSAETGVRLRITGNLGVVAAWRWYRAHYEDGSPETVATPFGTATLDSSFDTRLEGPWVGIVLEF